MLERKRLRKSGAYTQVAGEDGDVVEDIELGEGIIGVQESGVVVSAAALPGVPEGRKMTVEEEVANWDENAADDWEAPPESAVGGDEGKKQRAD